MNEDYREACFIADKLWAFFVGMAWESAEADELIKNADWLRDFIRNNMYNMRSSDLLPKE